MLSGAFLLSALLGLASSVVVGVVAVLTEGAVRTALLTLALCVPFVTTQDALRLGALSRRDPDAHVGTTEPGLLLPYPG